MVLGNLPLASILQYLCGQCLLHTVCTPNTAVDPRKLAEIWPTRLYSGVIGDQWKLCLCVDTSCVSFHSVLDLCDCLLSTLSVYRCAVDIRIHRFCEHTTYTKDTMSISEYYTGRLVSLLDRSLMTVWRTKSWNPERVASVFTFVCVCPSIRRLQITPFGLGT